MKPPLLILHGAIGASVQFLSLAEKLSDQYEVHLFDFPGHGGKAFAEEPFSIKLFSDSVLEYIQGNNIPSVTIFGYSMGGYVAMLLAKEHPQLTERIITLGTKFHWHEAVAEKEIKMLNPEAIVLKLPGFAAVLEKMHAPNDWKEVLNRTAGMLATMGKDNPLKPEDFTRIQTPVRIMLGDRDKMVTLEETLAVYKALPHAQQVILPSTPHPIEQVDISLLAGMINH